MTVASQPHRSRNSSSSTRLWSHLWLRSECGWIGPGNCIEDTNVSYLPYKLTNHSPNRLSGRDAAMKEMAELLAKAAEEAKKEGATEEEIQAKVGSLGMGRSTSWLTQCVESELAFVLVTSGFRRPPGCHAAWVKQRHEI